MTAVRVASVLTAMMLTAGYLFVLYGITWYSCFGKTANCRAGWMPRTIATAVYLGIVYGLVELTWWLSRVIARRRAAGK